MKLKIIQSNLNHCWQAYDLLQQFMAEHSIDIGFLSEPVMIHPSSRWLVSLDGRAAITRSPSCTAPLSLRLRRNEFVVGTMDDMTLITCYCSPNTGLSHFEDLLSELDEMMMMSSRGDLPSRILLCGDLNAKSTYWGSPFSDPRGRLLERWSAQWNLCLINNGSTPTCVRYQGSSYVDVTWTSPPLAILEYFRLDCIGGYGDLLGPPLYNI